LSEQEIEMLITHEMDYAVRTVRALYRNGQLSAPAIAEAENMPNAVTYKVIKKLLAADILESRRGMNGGYFLKVSCDTLTLYDLFHALGEDLVLTECLDADYPCPNNKNGECRSHREFSRIQKVMEKELRRTPLSELFT